jgi:DNA repair exonuclease SbcCD ATPase subunit
MVDQHSSAFYVSDEGWGASHHDQHMARSKNKSRHKFVGSASSKPSSADAPSQSLSLQGVDTVSVPTPPLVPSLAEIHAAETLQDPQTLLSPQPKVSSSITKTVSDQLESLTQLLAQQIERLHIERQQGCERETQLSNQRKVEQDRRFRILREYASRLRARRERTKQQRTRLAERLQRLSRSNVSSSLLVQMQEQLVEAEREFAGLTARCEQIEQARQRAVELELERRTMLEVEQQHRSDLELQVLEQLEELDQLRQELSRVRSTPALETPEPTVAIESADSLEIRSRLERITAERDELRIQNSDLASQLAKVEVRRADSNGGCANQALSWEERKAKILARLEEEDTTSESEREDLQGLIARTDGELQRKDREIEELRRLLQEQSGAMQGVAVGAATFAEMLENDELIQEERQKLREMQKEWEDKLRSAEIELSFERARLARERLEVEQKVEELQRRLQEVKQTQVDLQHVGPGAQPKPVRRWLAHLGLNEAR